MRQLYFKIAILLLMLFVISGVQGQNKIYIHTKDGTKSSFLLNEIRKLTLPSRTITIYQNDGNTKTFPFIDLRQARFTEWLSDNNSLDFTDINNLTLYPNPVIDELTLRIGSISSGTVDIRIMDIHGKTVCIKNERIYQGPNQIEIKLSDLPQGIYVCRIINGKSTETRKFLKN